MPVFSFPSEKAPAPPLPELDVGGQVQLSRGPEPLHVRRPLLHRAAPLQQDGPLARQGQHQGGEEAGGAGSGDDGRELRRGPCLRRRVDRTGHRPAHMAAAAAAEDGGLVRDGRLRGVHQPDILPGVHTAADHPEGENVLLPHPEDAGGLADQLRRAGLRRELDGLDS